jgi:hypothetical protein
MKQEGNNNLQAGRDINIDKLIISLVSIGKRPTKIARVISQIAKEVNVDIPEDYSAVNFYQITDKISYNNVIKYKPIIDRYGFFGGLVEGICEKLDTDKPNSKSRIFEYITYLYTIQKANLCGDSSQEECLKLIQENADDIIYQINNKLYDLIKDSSDLEGVDAEDVQISLAILIAVAFINCKILEKPII